MRLAIVTIACALSAAPVAAESWYELSPGEEYFFAGDWVGLCTQDKPFQCSARVTIGATGSQGPGQVILWWEPWGDEGHSFTFFATDAPAHVTGPNLMTVNGQEFTLAEDREYTAIAGDMGDVASHMIAIGEPLVVDDLLENMKAGEALIWSWGKSRLSIPLTGFAETVEAVGNHREELLQ